MSQVRKDVLNGWKEIAAYLGRDPRTVERWEKSRSLPVRRLPGSGRSTVYALVSELDAWLASPVREPDPDPRPVFGELPTMHVPLGADPAKGSASASAAEIPDGSSEQDAGVGWLRWTVAGTLIVAILCGGTVAAVKHLRRDAATASSASHVRTLVPSSTVPGVEELYLRGCYQTELRSPESLHHAQDAFAAALAKDPRYAPAFAGLATTYILLREYSIVPDAEAYPQAKDAATKAILLDRNLPQAHAVMGFVDFFWTWDAAAAEKQFQTALRLEPSLPLAHHWYGSMLTHEGRYGEALRELNVAQRLEPSSSAILTMRAFAMGLSGRRDESSELLNEAISTEHSVAYHNSATMHHVMGSLSLLAPRDVPRFLSEETIASELREDASSVAALRLATDAYRASGERAMWQALLAEEQKRHRSGGPSYNMARYESELGDKDRALGDIAELYSRHDSALIGILVDPLFVGLRQDPRFARVRDAMGLPNPDRN